MVSDPSGREVNGVTLSGDGDRLRAEMSLASLPRFWTLAAAAIALTAIGADIETSRAKP